MYFGFQTQTLEETTTMLEEGAAASLKARRPSLLSRLHATVAVRGYEAKLYLATCIGNVPSHFLRNAYYRRILGIRLPKDSIVYWKARFFCPAGIMIGHHTVVGNDAFLDGRCGLTIGNNVNIAAEVRVYTMEHDITSETFAATGMPVVIDDYVYIGTRVTILPGVHIGEGATVASGAVVTRSVDPWTVVGGVPAKEINKRPMVRYTLDTGHKMLLQ
jgi:acetyltransferase-like isoleucine patch superfamily enzyme